MRSANSATVSATRHQEMAIGKLVAAETRDDAAFRSRGQPIGNGAQHEIAIGVAEHVVDLLEAVEANYQQRDFGCLAFARPQIIAASRA